MKIVETYRRFLDFFVEVGIELKKSEWPTPSELMESTIIVIVSVAGLGLMVFLSDFVLMHLLGWLV